MQEGATRTRRTLALLSPSYFRSDYTTAEWRAALCRDPLNRKRTLVPVRIADCQPAGLLGPLVYTDLLGKEEAAARATLRAAIQRLEKRRGKPALKPGFPGRAEGKPLRLPSVLPEPFNVPARNPNFTGRRELLEQLRQALSASGTAAVTAVYGLGGVGKTQLALEYAWRYHTSYRLMWWIRAEEAATFTTDCAALAEALGVVERGFADQAAAASAALDWLRRNDGWLLVFDNAAGPAHIRRYVPPSASGHTIVTSRNPAWRGEAGPLEVNVLDRAEAVEFLLKRSGQTDRAAAGALAEDLGHLPLALEQAAAYVEQTGITLSGFGLANQAFQYEKDQLDTWPASTRQVAHVLAAAGHGERLGVALESVGRLLNDSGTYLFDRGRLHEAEDALKRALAIDEKVYGPEHPKVAVRANNIGQILKAKGDLAGALKYTQWALAIDEKVYGPEHPNVAIRANNIGMILKDMGDLAGALKCVQRALQILEATYGPGNPSTEKARSNVEQVKRALGQA